MDLTTGGREPARYRLRVQGHLDARWSAWFEGLALTHESDGTTNLTGIVTDQAALHGVLTKIRDLGLTLVSVAAIDVLPAISAEAPKSLGKSGFSGKARGHEQP